MSTGNEIRPPESCRTLRGRVASFGPLAFVMYAGLTSFAVYSCMYAFRKGFTAGAYDDLRYFGITMKVWMLAAQSVGYMASKVYGIRFISELRRTNRHRQIITLVGCSWVALFFFGITPAPYNLVFMLLNGFPLGLVWGVVFSYIEGRTTSELLGCILSASMIFSAGLVRTIGKVLLVAFSCDPVWMPFLTGAVFVVPLVVCSFLLENIPPPTPEDIGQRRERTAMTAADRAAFMKFFGKALIPALGAYVLLSVLRDVRDNFSNEILTEAGYGANPGVFTITESVIAVVLIFVVGSLFRIRCNYRAFMVSHLFITVGFLGTAAATYLHMTGRISPIAWMIASGTALYGAYLPFSCTYFERMLPVYGAKGNVGYILYLADALGYLGAVTATVVKEFSSFEKNWIGFLGRAYYVAAAAGILLIGTAFFVFRKMHRRQLEAGTTPEPTAPADEPHPYPDAI